MGCLVLVLAGIGAGLTCPFLASTGGTSRVVLQDTREVTCAPGAVFDVMVRLRGLEAKDGYGYRAQGPEGGPVWSFGQSGGDGACLGGSVLAMRFQAPSRPGEYSLTGKFAGWFGARLHCAVHVLDKDEQVGPALGLVAATVSSGGQVDWAWREGAFMEGGSATPLADGSVLLAGGWQDRGRPLASSAACRYWPGQQRTVSVGPLAQARAGQEALLLKDGRVLLFGGESLAIAEVFDPASNQFTALPQLPGGWSENRICLLASGEVLVYPYLEPGKRDPEACLGHPPQAFVLADRTLAPSSLGPVTLRERPTLTRLQDGRVLVVGAAVLGHDPDRLQAPAVQAMAEFYDPGQRLFSPGPATLRGRREHRAQLLADGRVLILGGWSNRYQAFGAGGPVWLNQMECFDPATGQFRDGGRLDGIDPGPVVPMPDGSLMVVLNHKLFRVRPGMAEPGLPIAPKASVFPSEAALLSKGQVLLLGPSAATSGIFYP